MPDRLGLGSFGGLVAPGDALELFVAVECGDLGIAAEIDVGIFFDPMDQVARHGVGEIGAAHQHVHALGVLREENGGLSGGVAAADYDDLFTIAELRFDEGGSVVETGAFEGA